MKHARYTVGILVTTTVCFAALINGGCSNVPVAFEDFTCNSTPFESNAACPKQSDADAGADAESDAGTDGSALKDDTRFMTGRL